MKILITGGAGFIGTNIAIEAINRNHEVIVFDSFIRKGVEDNLLILEREDVKIFRGDVRNKEDFTRLSTEYPQIEAIIHLAGNPGIPWSITYPMYDFEVNALGTINVLEFARQMGNIPVIYASTNKVYSDMVNEAPYIKSETRYVWYFNKEALHGISRKGISEEFPTDGFGNFPHSPYGVSKLAGDLYCQEYFHTYNLPVVINRMSCVYGYYQQGVADQGWIDHFVRQFVFKGHPELDFYGDGKQVRDMLWSEDVARLYLDELKNIKKIKGQIFNIGGGHENTLSLKESINYLEELTTKKVKITYHPWRHADQRIYISNIAKIYKILGWKPIVNPKQGIKKMFEKYDHEKKD